MKAYIITAILISLLLLSGASGCPSFGQQTTTTAVTAAGLDVSFVTDAPPLSVSVNQEFPMYINVQNNGGDFVSKGAAKFYLAGAGPTIENVKSVVSNEATLEPASPSPYRVAFADRAKITSPIVSLLMIPLAVTSCYNYGTTAQAPICVAKTNSSSLCSVSGDKAVTNTVAPVQISGLSENVVGNKLSISFTIENKLNGQIYLPDTDCDKLLQAQDFIEISKNNKLSIKVSSTETELSCHIQSATPPYSSLDGLSGVSQVGKVTCEETVPSTGDHVSPIYIILQYKYVSSMAKNLNVLP